MFWVCPGASYQWDMPGTPPTWGAQEASWSDTRTTSTDPFWWEGAAALPRAAPDVRTPYPVSKAEPSHPTEETHFSRLYPQSHSFGHYPELVSIGEGWDVDGPINQELRLPAHLCLSPRRSGALPHHCRSNTKLPIDLTLHSTLTCNLDPKILEHLRLGQ